jgi:hypothetical protein
VINMPAIPIIQAIGAAASAYGAYKSAKSANDSVMGYGDALNQAQTTLDSLYNNKVTSAVNSLDNASASRGFYGQAAADQLKSNTIGDIRANQASNVASLANQLQTGSAQQAAYANNQFQNSLTGLANTVPKNQNYDAWGTLGNWGSQLGRWLSGGNSGVSSGINSEYDFNKNYGNRYTISPTNSNLDPNFIDFNKPLY